MFRETFFVKHEAKYLGKIISEEGYRDDQIGVEAIQKLKQKPYNIGDLT